MYRKYTSCFWALWCWCIYLLDMVIFLLVRPDTCCRQCRDLQLNCPFVSGDSAMMVFFLGKLGLPTCGQTFGCQNNKKPAWVRFFTFWKKPLHSYRHHEQQSSNLPGQPLVMSVLARKLWETRFSIFRLTSPTRQTHWLPSFLWAVGRTKTRVFSQWPFYFGCRSQFDPTYKPSC